MSSAPTGTEHPASSSESTGIDLAVELESRVAALWWRLLRETPGELSRTAAAVLATLRQVGPQRVCVLAEREAVAQPSMTTLVNRLERKGLVERRCDVADARACLVALTTSGEEALTRRSQLRAEWLGERLDRIDAARRETLHDAFATIDRLLDDERGPA